MQQQDIHIRQAIKSDAPIIAHAVAMAIGDEKALKSYCGKDYINVITKIAENKDSQYSYLNTLIAEMDGNTLGAIIGYDGAKLHELRATTYSIIYNELGQTPSIPDETEAGEFYIDTIAVLPQYRGRGIGRLLIASIRDKAFADGHKHIGLIVDFDNPQAESLYTSIGFVRVGTKFFLGHKMWHMQSCK